MLLIEWFKTNAHLTLQTEKRTTTTGQRIMTCMFGTATTQSTKGLKKLFSMQYTLHCLLEVQVHIITGPRAR